jgi:hypothetical protein
MPKKETPPAAGRRSQIVFANSSDTGDSILPTTPQPYPVAWLRDRYGLPLLRARVVAALAGIGRPK